MAYLGLFAVMVAAEPFGCSFLLDKGPYRLERGGVADEFMLPPGLMRSKVHGRMRCRTGGVMECATMSLSRPLTCETCPLKGTRKFPGLLGCYLALRRIKMSPWSYIQALLTYTVHRIACNCLRYSRD